jgi:type VI secretion system protein ImpA
MPSAAILDVDALLAPIAGENPAGEALRYAGIYDTIKEARRADDDLPSGEWKRKTKTADWQAVIRLATEALTTRSKDLQITAWLVEALIQRHSFPGLRDGLHLLWELQERFWDHLYPQIEGGDLESRATLLEWVNEKLPPILRQSPLTQGTNGERYSWLRWEESRKVDDLGRKDQAAMEAALSEGKITGEQFDKAVDTTPLEYYQTLFEDLRDSRKEYDALQHVVDDKFGQEGAPSLRGLKETLDACQELVEDILNKRGGLVTEPASAQLDTAPAPQAAPLVKHDSTRAASSAPPIQGGLSLEPQDRSDAIQRLLAVAAYFRRTEPHSPVPYLVQRAVHWANLPLEQWLQYVIHDTTSLESIRETLGLKDSPSSDS